MHYLGWSTAFSIDVGIIAKTCLSTHSLGILTGPLTASFALLLNIFELLSAILLFAFAVPFPAGKSGSFVVVLYVADASTTSNCTVALPSLKSLVALPTVL